MLAWCKELVGTGKSYVHLLLILAYGWHDGWKLEGALLEWHRKLEGSRRASQLAGCSLSTFEGG